MFSEEIRLQVKALNKINDWQLSYTDLLHARVEYDGKMRDFFRSELTFVYEKPITVELLRDINTNTKVTIIVPTRRGDVKIYALLSEIKKNSYIAEMIVDVCSMDIPRGIPKVPLYMANTYSIIFEPEIQDWDKNISREKLRFAEEYETVPDEELNLVHNLVPKNSVYRGSEVWSTLNRDPPGSLTFWEKYERIKVWSDELQEFVFTTLPTNLPYIPLQRPRRPKNHAGILPNPVNTRVARPASEQKKARKPPISLLLAMSQNKATGQAPSSSGVFKAPIGPAVRRKNGNGQAPSGLSRNPGASQQQHGQNSNDDDCVVIKEVTKQKQQPTRNAFQEGEVITLDDDAALQTEPKKSANAAKKARRKQRRYEAQLAILESLKSGSSNSESIVPNDIPMEVESDHGSNAGSEDQEVVHSVEDSEKAQKVAEQPERNIYLEWGAVGDNVSAANFLFESGQSTSGLNTGWPFLGGKQNQIIADGTPSEISNEFDNLSLSKYQGEKSDEEQQTYEPIYTPRRPSDAASDDTDFPGFVDFSKPREEMQTPKTPPYYAIPDRKKARNDSTGGFGLKSTTIDSQPSKEEKEKAGNISRLNETTSDKEAKSHDNLKQIISAATKTQSSSSESVSRPGSAASTESRLGKEFSEAVEQHLSSTGDATPDEILSDSNSYGSSSKYPDMHREEPPLPGDATPASKNGSKSFSSSNTQNLPASRSSQTKISDKDDGKPQHLSNKSDASSPEIEKSKLGFHKSRSSIEKQHNASSESKSISTDSRSESPEKKRRPSVVDLLRKQSSDSTGLQESIRSSSSRRSSSTSTGERREDSLKSPDLSLKDFDPTSFWKQKPKQSSSSATHSDFSEIHRKSLDRKSSTSSDVSSTPSAPPPPKPLISLQSSRGNPENKRTKRPHDDSEERQRSVTSDKQSEESLKRAEFKKKVADYTEIMTNLFKSGKTLEEILNSIIDEEKNTLYTSHDVMDKVFVDKIFKIFHATMLTMDEEYGPKKKGEAKRKLSGEIKDWTFVRFIAHVSEVIDTFSSSDNFLQVMQNETFVKSLEKFFVLIKEKSIDMMKRKNLRLEKEREHARLKREQKERRQQELKQLERRQQDDDEPRGFGNRQRKESGHNRRWF
ncbi:unnamed protein product [Caenorhabditis brenneri]